MVALVKNYLKRDARKILIGIVLFSQLNLVTSDAERLELTVDSRGDEYFSPIPETQKPLTLEQRRKLGEQLRSFGWVKDADTIVNSYERKQPHQPTQYPIPPSSSQILYHFKGKEGVSFPRFEKPADFGVDESALLRAAEALVERTESNFDAMFQEKIPNCFADGQEEVNADSHKLGAHSPTDMTFIAKGSLKESEATAMRAETDLQEVSYEEPSDGAMLARLLNVPCVPYRIHSDGKVIQLLRGKRALQLRTVEKENVEKKAEDE